MKMAFACEVDHEPEHQMLGRTVRVNLRQGVCPICPGQRLDGKAYTGLGWAHCACCGSQWRLEDEGFALRPGRIVEEWNEPSPARSLGRAPKQE
jgi:hypothetical protein